MIDVKKVDEVMYRDRYIKHCSADYDFVWECIRNNKLRTIDDISKHYTLLFYFYPINTSSTCSYYYHIFIYCR